MNLRRRVENTVSPKQWSTLFDKNLTTLLLYHYTIESHEDKPSINRFTKDTYTDYR